MKKILLLISAYSGFLVGCSNTNNSTGNDATPVIESSSEQNNEGAVIPAPAEIPSPTIQPTTDPVVTTVNPSATISAPQQQATSTAAGMNPAHGQPGHRCDIAVGAPLNSPAGVNPTTAAPTPSAAPAPVTVPSASPAAPVVTETSGVTPPGMNPPHGEPGHDCAIAVGAPLKK